MAVVNAQCLLLNVFATARTSLPPNQLTRSTTVASMSETGDNTPGNISAHVAMQPAIHGQLQLAAPDRHARNLQQGLRNHNNALLQVKYTRSQYTWLFRMQHVYSIGHQTCARLGYDRTVPAGAMALDVSDSGAQLQQPAGDIPTGPRASMRRVGSALDMACVVRCPLSVAFRLVHAMMSCAATESIRCMLDVACCKFYCACCALYAAHCVLRVVHCMFACHVARCLCSSCCTLRAVCCGLHVV
jgi:hypothetical protein